MASLEYWNIFKSKSKMNFYKIIEYAIYHDCLNKKKSLPGIENGLPIKSFFKNYKKYNQNYFEEFTKYSISKTLKNINDISLLCSGGVDSSILVKFLVDQKKNFLAIHSYYPNHKKNDLNKILSLKKFYKFKSLKKKICAKSYKNGINKSFSYNYYGNTYSPTLYSMSEEIKKQSTLITGSGPDELFYGMENHSIKKILSLKNEKISNSLEYLDNDYNLKFYSKLFNKKGNEILNKIKINRRKLYKKIESITDNILEAQRILAYCIITSQHYEMFETFSKNIDVNHCSPFLSKDYIEFAFSLKVSECIDKKIKPLNANSGKKQLKLMLSKYTSKKHSYDKKIGFHAPVSNIFTKHLKIEKLVNQLNNENVCRIFDVKKLKKEIKNPKNYTNKNYFIYSLVGVLKLLQKP